MFIIGSIDIAIWRRLHCCSYLTRYSLLLFFILCQPIIFPPLFTKYLPELQRTKSHGLPPIGTTLYTASYYIYRPIYVYIYINTSAATATVYYYSLLLECISSVQTSTCWPLYINIYLTSLIPRLPTIYIHKYTTTYAWHVFICICI